MRWGILGRHSWRRFRIYIVLLFWERGKGRRSLRRKWGLFIWKYRGGKGFRGGEAGWCTAGLGGCRGQGGGANDFYRAEMSKNLRGWQEEIILFLLMSTSAPRTHPIRPIRVSFCSFSSLLPMKQLFSCQLSLPKACVSSIQMSSSPKVLDLDDCFSSE